MGYNNIFLLSHSMLSKFNICRELTNQRLETNFHNLFTKRREKIEINTIKLDKMQAHLQ